MPKQHPQPEQSSGSFKRWIPTLLILVIYLLGVCIFYNIYGGLGLSPLRIDRIACNGGRMMALRLPSDTGGHQEQILIYPTDTSRSHSIRREDIHIRASQPSCGSNGQLTIREWEAVNALRLGWCATPPSFRELDEQEPFYDLGLACGADPTAIGTVCKRIQIPLDQVPPELQMLVDELPPTWPDPDCKEE